MKTVHRAIWIPLLLLALALSAPASAATSLTLEQAVSAALGRHPALSASEQGVAAAHARTRQARTAWLPRLSVDGAYRYQGPVPELALDTGITLPGTTEPLSISREIGSAHVASASVTAGLRALDFGARSARIDAAAALERAARAEGAEREAEIAFAVRMAYLGVVLEEEVSRVTQGSLEVTREALARAEASRSAGLAAGVEVAGAKARVAELRGRLIEATQGRERVAGTLRILLGLPAGEELLLSDRLETLQPAVAARASEGAQTPTDRRLVATTEALVAQEAAVRRSALPTLDLYATGGYQFPRTFVETDEAGFVWAAGVKLSWEAFDGGLRARQREELRARTGEVAALRQAATEETRRAVGDAEARLQIASASGEAAAAQVEAATAYLEAARGAASGGLGTALEVRRAEAAVDQARLAELKARFDAAAAGTERLRALGVAEARSPGARGGGTMKRFAVIFVVLVAAVSAGLYLELRSQAREAARASGGSAIIEGEEADVVTRLPLRIKEVLAEEGDVVEAGQLMVLLDCAEPEAALAQAQAAVAAAQAGVAAAEVGVALARHGVGAAERQTEAASAQAKAAKAQSLPLRVQQAAAARAAARVESLHDKGGASDQDLDAAKTQASALNRQLRVAGAGAQAAGKQALAVGESVEAARLGAELGAAQRDAAMKQVVSAEAASRRAQVSVDECRLYAPRHGEITRRNVEPGEVALPGTPLLTLMDIREARATFYLPNAELEAAQPGRELEVVADAMPERTFTGTIRRVATEAEFTPRNVQTREDRDRLVYAVEVRIPNPDGALRPGMPVEITIPSTRQD